MYISKRERYRGALVGVLAGDALGAPYETWNSEKVLEDFKKRGGLVPFEYPDPWGHDSTFPAGRPTDDSDHTAALAESLVARKGLDQADLYYRLRRVLREHVSPLWSGKAVGAGKTTRTMLRPETWEESQALSSDGAFPSNGSLMRSAPLALFFGSGEKVCMNTVRHMSEVTHRHEDAFRSCAFYIAAMTNILTKQSDPLFEYKLVKKYFPKEHPLVFECSEKPRDPEKWPGRGAAVLTLHTGLWALLTADDFRDGITKVVALGGDTDTYAAVAGGLLGAKFGLEGIPKEWREVLLGKEKMIELADQLYYMAHA